VGAVTGVKMLGLELQQTNVCEKKGGAHQSGAGEAGDETRFTMPDAKDQLDRRETGVGEQASTINRTKETSTQGEKNEKHSR